MSPLTTSTHPSEELDDEPTIDPDLYRYIVSLNESPNCYSRFFGALLIPKSSHADFFADLKTFREQPVIISLLEPGTSEAYRGCTRSFVASRFAHPWCRVNSEFQSGWTRASWVGATKKVSKEEKKEEDRLHGLLVPIWIAFRRRMFPERAVLEEWLAKEDERQKESTAQTKARTVNNSTSQNPDSGREVPTTDKYPELGFKMGNRDISPSETADSASSASGAATASRMFIGAAFGSYIMRDKRVAKYVKKKLLK